MKYYQNSTVKVEEKDEKQHLILDHVDSKDWQLIASLTSSIKEDFAPVSRFVELRSKIRAGIYHVDKDLIIDTMIKKMS